MLLFLITIICRVRGKRRRGREEQEQEQKLSSSPVREADREERDSGKEKEEEEKEEEQERAWKVYEGDLPLSWGVFVYQDTGQKRPRMDRDPPVYEVESGDRIPEGGMKAEQPKDYRLYISRYWG